MNITPKKVQPAGLGAGDAFMQQRGKEINSERLRQAVKDMLSPGRAHTTTVAKVFELILKDSPSRFSRYDVAKVLRDFDVA